MFDEIRFYRASEKPYGAFSNRPYSGAPVSDKSACT